MRLFIFVFLLLASFNTFAQIGVVRGEVFDDNGLLPGVDISVSDISTSISTDADGAFAVKLKPGQYDFIFRFPQYNNEERVVKVNVSEIEDIEVKMKVEVANKERLELEKNTQMQLEEMLSTVQVLLVFIKQSVLRIK